MIITRAAASSMNPVFAPLNIGRSHSTTEAGFLRYPRPARGSADSVRTSDDRTPGQPSVRGLAAGQRDAAVGGSRLRTDLAFGGPSSVAGEPDPFVAG